MAQMRRLFGLQGNAQGEQEDGEGNPLVPPPPPPPSGGDDNEGYADRNGGDIDDDSQGGRGRETPRETSATQRRPMTPTSGAGSAEGVKPFQPMKSGAIGISAPMQGGLFGGQGGLTGGGLGLPLQGSGMENENISELIRTLMQRMG